MFIKHWKCLFKHIFSWEGLNTTSKSLVNMTKIFFWDKHIASDIFVILSVVSQWLQFLSFKNFPIDIKTTMLSHSYYCQISAHILVHSSKSTHFDVLYTSAVIFRLKRKLHSSTIHFVIFFQNFLIAEIVYLLLLPQYNIFMSFNKL